MGIWAVEEGMRFRSAYADSNALWEVTKRAGPKVWYCTLVNEPIEIDGKMYDSDGAGSTNVFEEGYILQSVRMEDLFEERANERGRFYDSLTVGQILHYHNGFGAFVRCEVVFDGENLLQPIALVGEWKHDLPRRLPDGTISMPYHAKHVLNREGAWRADPGCIYEHPRFHDRTSKGIDPTTLSPIDLMPPELTDKERKNVSKVHVLIGIEAAIDHNNPIQSLAAIRSILEDSSE